MVNGKRTQTGVRKGPKVSNRMIMLVVVFGMIALMVSPYVFPGDLYSPDVDLEDYGSIHVFYLTAYAGVPGWSPEVFAGDPTVEVGEACWGIGVSHLKLLGKANYLNDDIEGMLYCKETGQKLGTSEWIRATDIVFGDYMLWTFSADLLLDGEHTYFIVLHGQYDSSHTIGAQTFDFKIDHPDGGHFAAPVVDSEVAQYSVETGVATDIVFSYINLWDIATWKVVVDGTVVDVPVAASFDGEMHEVTFVFIAKKAKIFTIVFVMEYGTGNNVRAEVQVVATGEDIVDTTTTTDTTTDNTTDTTTGTTTGTTNTTTGGTDWEGYIEVLEKQMEQLIMLLVATVAVFAGVVVVLLYSGGRRR